jgi:hypothetical protein
MNEGSWVGLDVHARSVVAGVIDQGSGEVRSLRVPPGSDATVAWLKTLPAPVRVVYEAGPTGYRLARACAEAGINCVVAVPSRIRAAADRLARLLRLGEITPIRVPMPEEEAARDLSPREECGMARYLISFDHGAMDDIPDEEGAAVGEAAHAVVQESKDAGVFVFAGGCSEEVSVVALDGTVTDAPKNKAYICGVTIVDVSSRKAALHWAAKIAAACRCAQEFREIMPDPAVGN